jgi:molecular chaperone GrpE
MTSAEEPHPNEQNTTTDGQAPESAAPESANQESDGKDKAPEDRTVEDWESLIEFQRNRAETNFNGWQRSQADYSNHKRRADQERGDALRYGGAPALIQTLSIADDMDRALRALPIALARLTWIEGVEIIYRKLLATLESSGVKEIEAAGQQFDPNIHEAIAQTDGPEGQVIEVVQRGFMLYDRVLRPSLVQVGNGDVATADEPESDADTTEPEEMVSDTTEDRE